MKIESIVFFGIKPYEYDSIKKYFSDSYFITLLTDNLNLTTTYLAENFDAVVVFSKDDVSKTVVQDLSNLGVKLICTRATGYDNIDVEASTENGISVANVPSYSPESIAEHSVMMMLVLLKKYKKAQAQFQRQNFELNNLISSNLGSKTVGVVGVGSIGKTAIKMLAGFGTNILAYDKCEDLELSSSLGFSYVGLNSLLKESDIVSLYLPSTPETKYIINAKSLSIMKSNSFIVNTGRGMLINTSDLISFLKNGKLAGAALDVYENEKEIFFQDFSDKEIDDDNFLTLMNMDQVVMTAHQAFLTFDSLEARSRITLENIQNYNQDKLTKNFITPLSF